MQHTCGRPYHPQAQGKIERWHRFMKSQVLLENYYSPGDLKLRIGEFVEYYNHERCHESLKNLAPADVYYGRGQSVPDCREKIKLKTLAMRRQVHYDRLINQAA